MLVKGGELQQAKRECLDREVWGHLPWPSQLGKVGSRDNVASQTIEVVYVYVVIGVFVSQSSLVGSCV